MNLGHLVLRSYFHNFGNLICRSTDISNVFQSLLEFEIMRANCSYYFSVFQTLAKYSMNTNNMSK